MDSIYFLYLFFYLAYAIGLCFLSNLLGKSPASGLQNLPRDKKVTAVYISFVQKAFCQTPLVLLAFAKITPFLLFTCKEQKVTA